MKRRYTLRNKILLLLLLAAAGVAKAQTHEFAPVGAEWYYGRQTMFTWGYIRILVTNDTIIDGHTCSILNKEEHGFNYYSQNLYHFDIGREYVTQEKDAVLIYRKGIFYKLFDFDAEIGDSWTIPGNEEEDGRVIMCGKGTEIVDGNELRYILITDEISSPYGYGNWSPDDPLSPPDTIKVLERIGPIGAYLLPKPLGILDYDGEGGVLRCYSDDIVEVNYSWPIVYCDYINDNYIGFEENVKVSNYGIYPNPTNKSVWITISDDFPISICIFDSIGRRVYSEVKTGSLSCEIDLGFLSPGIYWITISNDQSIYSNKIIKL